MAGIYIHIPFCRKACHYCNFHFSTSLHRKPELLQALLQEISGQYLPIGVAPEKEIQTIYFGGGTPSLLEPDELQAILTAIRNRFEVAYDAEITLESNPDDITPDKLKSWRKLGFNRLSIGVQSFFDADLKWMNRAHNAGQAEACIKLAKSYGFHNLTIDLIYGTPTLTDENWRHNVETALALEVNHLSCYALTVEENTALDHFIRKGKVPAVEEEKQGRHFEMLMDWMQTAGFEHYEVSNFAKPGHRSRHNGNYWAGVPYYGFGPSAHSFDGQLTRWWNIANNAIYIDKMAASETIFELEELTPEQRLNETIMTGLRTIEGLPVDEQQKNIAHLPVTAKQLKQFLQIVKNYEQNNLVTYQNGTVQLTKEGKLYADGIAAKLFVEK
jgi:oxygen-independent coproporphyrinogen-3 oxidase